MEIILNVGMNTASISVLRVMVKLTVHWVKTSQKYCAVPTLVKTNDCAVTVGVFLLIGAATQQWLIVRYGRDRLAARRVRSKF